MRALFCRDDGGHNPLEWQEQGHARFDDSSFWKRIAEDAATEDGNSRASRDSTSLECLVLRRPRESLQPIDLAAGKGTN
jgi:hypothetical protein